MKPGDIGWRCPGSDAAFGFIVEQLFAPENCTAILMERGGTFAPARIPQLVCAHRTCDAPPNWLHRVGLCSVQPVLQFAQHCNGLAAMSRCNECTTSPKVIRRTTAGSVENMLATRTMWSPVRWRSAKSELDRELHNISGCRAAGPAKLRIASARRHASYQSASSISSGKGSRRAYPDPTAAKVENGTPRRGQSVPRRAFGAAMADAPTAALLTGLVVAVGPAYGGRYADAPSAASFLQRCFARVRSARRHDPRIATSPAAAWPPANASIPSIALSSTVHQTPRQTKAHSTNPAIFRWGP